MKKNKKKGIFSKCQYTYDTVNSKIVLGDFDNELIARQELLERIKENKDGVKKEIDGLKAIYTKRGNVLGLLSSLFVASLFPIIKFAGFKLGFNPVMLNGIYYEIAAVLLAFPTAKVFTSYAYDCKYKKQMTLYKILEGREKCESSKIDQLSKSGLYSKKIVELDKKEASRDLKPLFSISNSSNNKKNLDFLSSDINGNKQNGMMSSLLGILKKKDEVEEEKAETNINNININTEAVANINMENITIAPAPVQDKPKREHDFAKDIEIFQLLRASMDELYGYYKEGILQEKLVEKYNDNYYIEVITEKIEEKAAKEKTLSI